MKHVTNLAAGLLVFSSAVACTSDISERSESVSTAPLGNVSLGYGSKCIATTSGNLWCNGYNYFGQLGDGTTTDRLVAVQPQGIGATGNVAAIAHEYTSCARMNDSSLWCWGSNETGGLGLGYVGGKVLVPTQVGSGYAQVDGGLEGFTALRTDGRVEQWGFCNYTYDCYYDDLGSSCGWGCFSYTPTRVTLPEVDAAVGNQAVRVYDSGNSSCALKNDGALWCWGFNSGQLGASGVGAPIPPTVFSTGVTDACLGGDHTCVRKTDGSVWCAGNGWSDAQGAPKQVTGVGPTAAGGLVCTRDVACVLSGGDVICWGYNQDGLLGRGHRSTPEYLTPPGRVVGLPAPVRSLAAADRNVCATLADASVWCWGFNYWGQIGDGTTINRTVPVKQTLVDTSSGQCGNGTCNTSETTASCPADCGASCGDGMCNGGETASSCAADCAQVCGDGRCWATESVSSCTQDCASCGDGQCTGYEASTWCPADCGLLANGASCTDNFQCASNECWQYKCSPRLPNDASCTQSWECASHDCYQNKCSANLVGGSTCSGNWQCYSRDCFENHCSWRKWAGDACTANWECASHDCYQNVCWSTSPDGTACTANWQCASRTCTGGSCGAAVPPPPDNVVTCNTAVDSHIRASNKLSNYGAETTLIALGTGRRILVKFDMSCVPPGKTITAATLKLKVSNTTTNSFDVHQLLRAWNEMEVTYNKATSSVNWATPGAWGATDVNSTILGTLPANTPMSVGSTISVNLNASGVAVVQGWYTTPSTNYGFLTNGSGSNDLQVYSRESPGNQPTLQVTFR